MFLLLIPSKFQGHLHGKGRPFNNFIPSFHLRSRPAFPAFMGIMWVWSFDNSGTPVPFQAGWFATYFFVSTKKGFAKAKEASPFKLG